MDTLITELIELVKQAAPELWRIAHRQVLVHAIQTTVSIMASLLILVACSIAHKKLFAWWKSDEYSTGTFSDDGLLLSLGYSGIAIIGGAALLGGLSFLSVLIGFLVNPEYYAIKELLALVK